MSDNDFNEKRRKMLRIISVLKSKMKELEEIEKEIKSVAKPDGTTPAHSAAMLEEIIVPPLSVLKENEEKKGKK